MLRDGLRHQEAVERIAMMRGQFRETLGMRDVDGDLLEIRGTRAVDDLLQVSGDLAECGFDGDLPCARGAEVDLLPRIAQCRCDADRQAPRCAERLDQCVRVE